MRVKRGGGNAGHNGLRSITETIGNDYWRVRIGIGHPGDKDRVQPHVLSDFAKSEGPWVEALCKTIAANAELLARGEDASFQNKVHLAMVAEGFSARTGRTERLRTALEPRGGHYGRHDQARRKRDRSAGAL